ncbi:hypothetical protein IWW57_002398 [Coemansia sp. S610]|nr:hypothetical protein IWW57_002398 [Coemansia sp. S610]
MSSLPQRGSPWLFIDNSSITDLSLLALVIGSAAGGLAAIVIALTLCCVFLKVRPRRKYMDKPTTTHQPWITSSEQTCAVGGEQPSCQND